MLFKPSAYGPRPAFASCDLHRFLWLLRGNAKASRGTLTKALGLGEGSVRTIIRTLEKNKLIEVKRRGCGLTGKGAEALKSLGIRSAQPVPATELSYGKKAFAVVASGRREACGLNWRDEAVKAGADGATTLFLKRGALKLPISDYAVREADAKKIRDALELREGDAVVLGYGSTPLTAERGAWAAALALTRK